MQTRPPLTTPWPWLAGPPCLLLLPKPPPVTTGRMGGTSFLVLSWCRCWGWQQQAPTWWQSCYRWCCSSSLAMEMLIRMVTTWWQSCYCWCCSSSSSMEMLIWMVTTWWKCSINLISWVKWKLDGSHDMNQGHLSPASQPQSTVISYFASICSSGKRKEDSWRTSKILS